jgi:hypothetical protein
MAVAMWDASIPLTNEQRRRFIDLIMENTELPKRFGAYDYQLVLYHLAKLPHDKLKEILDEGQWDAYQALFRQARMMEPSLRQGGVIP